jgi:hypothetical protein
LNFKRSFQSLEAQLHLSIAMVRNGLHVVSRKMAVEALASIVSALLAAAILSHMGRPSVSLGSGERPAAGVEEMLASGATDSAVKQFIESVALAALSSNARVEPAARPVTVAASTEPDAPSSRASAPSQPPHPTSAKPRVRVWRPISRLAALPPQRPQLAAAAAVAAPAAPIPAAQAKSLPPLEHVARLSSDLWDSASSAGAFVVDNVASARDRLGAAAKGWM